MKAHTLSFEELIEELEKYKIEGEDQVSLYSLGIIVGHQNYLQIGEIAVCIALDGLVVIPYFAGSDEDFNGHFYIQLDAAYLAEGETRTGLIARIEREMTKIHAVMEYLH